MRTALNLQEVLSLEEWGPPVFEGGSKEEVTLWLDTIQTGCKERNIPENLLHIVGRRYLGERPKSYIAHYERSLSELSGGSFRWNWMAFEMAMVAMTLEAPAGFTEKAWEETSRLLDEHPGAARAAGAILLAGGATVLIPVASAAALSMIGFGTSGVAAGSLAAAYQSVMCGGYVAAGSLFAMAQSAGATGIAVASGAAQAAATVAVVAGSWLGWSARRSAAQGEARSRDTGNISTVAKSGEGSVESRKA